MEKFVTIKASYFYNLLFVICPFNILKKRSLTNHILKPTICYALWVNIGRDKATSTGERESITEQSIHYLLKNI